MGVDPRLHHLLVLAPEGLLYPLADWQGLKGKMVGQDHGRKGPKEELVGYAE